jgi:murein L,D-transpeptidase YcbB/YkuD
MAVARQAAFWIGTFCAASLMAGSLGATEAPAMAEGTPPLPALRASPGAFLEFALPLPPDAEVTITAKDRLQSAVAMQLTEALTDVSPRLPRKEREAIAAYYAETGYAPLWVKDGAWTPAANRLIARLRAAQEDGLEPLDYPIPAVASTKGEPLEDWAEAEVRLSATAVLYARDARGGRIEPSRLSSLVTPKLDLPGAEEVLRSMNGPADPGAVLAAYNPQHPGYRALKAKLAEIRQNRPGTPMVRVPLGPALRVGMRDPRVPLIRARFGIGPAGGDETSYDERVASAVAAFQREKGLPASGVLTPKTVAALSGPSPAQLEGDLIANMERWRWLPADLGERHIFVNIPEFRLRLFEGRDMVHQTRVVVGKTESPTPVFSDQMEYVIVNPSWTVPPSIMKKEFLPALARDPSYAARLGYEVIRRNGQISVRQPPGERNALGYVKFIFPNDHAVYLHDTPSRSLFAAERRAFSHGCVRVDQPFRLAEQVLSQQGNWSEEKLRSLVGKGERYIRLQEKLPVHLTYFTLAVDEHGQLKHFDDLYGHHAKVRAALGLNG